VSKNWKDVLAHAERQALEEAKEEGGSEQDVLRLSKSITQSKLASLLNSSIGPRLGKIEDATEQMLDVYDEAIVFLVTQSQLNGSSTNEILVNTLADLAASLHVMNDEASSTRLKMTALETIER